MSLSDSEPEHVSLPQVKEFLLKIGSLLLLLLLNILLWGGGGGKVLAQHSSFQTVPVPACVEGRQEAKL